MFLQDLSLRDQSFLILTELCTEVTVIPGSAAILPGFAVWPCHSLAVLLWAFHFTFLVADFRSK